MAEHDDLVDVDLTTDASKDKGSKKDPKDSKKDDVLVVDGTDKGKDAVGGGPTPDEVVAKLKKDLEDERTARFAAEKKARDEAAARSASESEVSTTQMQLVTGAIETTKRDSENLKSQYKAALAAQDYDAAADINEKMADNRARLLQLENGKSAMEDEARRAKERPAKVEIDDPVEKMASELTAPSADWVRRHPEYARNPRLTRKMIRAHEDIMEDGKVKADSPEYFDEIEKALNIDQPTIEVVVDQPLSGAAAPTKARTSPPAAPVSNSGTASGTRPGRVTLTKEEAEIAELNGMSNAEYYESKQALKKAGRLQ